MTTAQVAYDASYRVEHRIAIRDRNKKRLEWFAGNLGVLRSAQGCADCGTRDHLLHHHIAPHTKVCKVSDMSNYSVEKFIDEIAKCIVLCPACHAKRHVALRAAF